MTRQKGKKLVSRAALLGLSLLTLLGWGVLISMARQRQARAAWTAPSALSLRLLALSVANHPHDAALRLQLATKELEAGELESARAQLLNLSQQAAALPDAQLLLLNVEHARWSALAPSDASGRTRARADLQRALDALRLERATPQTAQRCAELYRELEQPVRAAIIFDELARNAHEDITALAGAEAAWLAAGLPLQAAELHAWFAARKGPDGVEHARTALNHARASGKPERQRDLIAQMRALYPADLPLLELSVTLTEASDVRRAYDLAAELTRLAPNAAAYHRQLARLAEATSQSLRALDEYVWLWRHEHRTRDRERAIELARENWDLQLVRTLLEGSTPASRPPPRRMRKGCQGAGSVGARGALQQRLELYEALGDGPAARRALEDAVATHAAADQGLWRRKLELELRLNDTAAALATLTQMLERFGSRELREQLADLQLALGRAHDASATLAGTPAEQRDTIWLRTSAQVAAAAGDMTAERRAYEWLMLLPSASPSDYLRLIELAPDRGSALQLTKAAAVRFERLDFAYRAAQLLRAAGDEQAELRWFDELEQLAGIVRNPDYWRTRVSRSHASATQRAAAADYPAAKRELLRAQELLERAARAAPDSDAYAPLWEAQRVHALEVGLRSADHELTAWAYARSAAKLSARERVYLLSKLGRGDEALLEARRALDADQLVDADRSVLQSDAKSLSPRRARQVSALGEAAVLPGLTILKGAARVEHADAARGLSAEANYTLYSPDLGSATWLRSQLHDLGAQVRGRLDPVALELGLSARASEPRLFGGLTLQLSGEGDRGLSVSVIANVAALDTARLRVLGVRDAVLVQAGWGIGKLGWSSVRITAEAYYTRRARDLLGSGVTLDAAVGSTHTLPSALGSLAPRLFVRGAPRFHEHGASASQWLPESSLWVGLGLALARGELGTVPLVGRQLAYVLDGAVGWLWPRSGFGCGAQAKLGVSLAGADLLSLGASASNVIGSLGWSAGLAYALSYDR